MFFNRRLAAVSPQPSRRLALAGRVVTMDDKFTVHDDGVVYVKDGVIAAVTERRAAAPSGFDGVEPVSTGGTIYPGLIELHNHLSYNVLPIWNVPKKFTNRDQWAQGDEYRKLVTGPMKVLAHTPHCVPAVVRYVEAKCLLGGTTTSQGLALSSYSGIMHFYRGIVRNVEQTLDSALPEAKTHIADVEATDRAKFLARLQHSSCLLLHLSEGTDDKAREHFLALHGRGDDWAITPALAGIHCVALQTGDFTALAKHGGSMIWSPLSNLLLYGATADIKAAKDAGLTIGIGPDWSPSGSKNALGELKIAKAVNDHAGGVFEDRELVAFATTNAAKTLKWEKLAGSLEAGKLADVLVVDGDGSDPYAPLFRATEKDLSLVAIGGVARFGKPDLVDELLSHGAKTETIKVGGAARTLNLDDPATDPDVAKVSLAEATATLTDAMMRLPELAKDLDKQTVLGALDAGATFLVLDHDDLPGEDQRPHLPGPGGELTAELPPVEAAATPLPDLLVPLELDPVTLADDGKFVDTLGSEQNLPAYLTAELDSVFG
jgi:5-methylthioadenosine/S-adenosylhomocysteine deaminase